MTARELIRSFQDLGEDNLDKEVIMFDCAYSYTPSKIQVLDETWGSLVGEILID